MISFVRHSKQPYWKPGTHPQEDDIMIGDYDQEGSGLWEFAVRQHIFPNADAVIQVEIDRDSVQALSSPLVISAITALKGCRTLDEAESRLSIAGISTKLRVE